MPNRYCFHADESYVNPITREFQVIRVTENEPGYTPVSENRDLAFCQDTARAMNAEHGLTDDDVWQIRTSSMRASQTVDGFTEHEIRLLRRGVKALRYELAKKARKTTFVPAEGGKDITKENLRAVEDLFAKVDNMLKAVQRAR